MPVVQTYDDVGNSTPNPLVDVIGLPQPRIYLHDPSAANMAPYVPSGLTTLEIQTGGNYVTAIRVPFLSALDVPDRFFDPAQDLRLEVLWYRSQKKSDMTPARRGFTHPKHSSFPSQNRYGLPVAATVLPNSRNYGGAPTYQRTTEYAVTEANPCFFLDGMGRFFIIGRVRYLNSTGGSGLVEALMPTSCWRRMAFGGTFLYSPNYRPNYFKFRYSVTDPNDPRSRLYGPVTTYTIAMATRHFPLVEMAHVDRENIETYYDVDPSLDLNILQAWYATRLPS